MGAAVGADVSGAVGAVGAAGAAVGEGIAVGAAVGASVLSTVGAVFAPVAALAAIGFGIYDLITGSESHHEDAIAAPTFTAGL